MNTTAVAVHSYFRGRLIDVQTLQAPPPGAVRPRRRRARHRNRGPRPDTYRIGAGRRADAPVAVAFIDGDEHALVTVDHHGAALNVTSRMVGRVRVPGGARTLDGLLPNGEGTIALSDGAHAEVTCGAMTFRIDATPDNDVMPVDPPPVVRWSEQRYTLAVAAAGLLLMLMLGSVPADRKSLSLDFEAAARRLDKYLIHAQEIPPVVTDGGARGADQGQAAPGGAGGPSGQAGTPTAPKRAQLQKLAVKGTSPRTELSEAPQPVTVLSLLGKNKSALVNSIFTRGSALGDDVDNVLGTLVASTEGLAWGPGGLGTTGTGAREGGTGESMLAGGGPLKIIGPGTGREGGPGGGHEPGKLHGKTTVPPEIIPHPPVVSGGLDKEIVRRIIRLHLNEIRYCYEQELPRHPTLAGRVAVQFVITAGGQVASSVVQDSTLHLAPLEGCMTQAVRRWSFPQPRGGGLTIVTYPFAFAPAGGA